MATVIVVWGPALHVCFYTQIIDKAKDKSILIFSIS